MSDVAPPLALLAELTHRCPLQCPYCSNPENLLKADQELDTEAWSAIFEEAAGLGILQVHFSGGEPTVRRDLVELVARAEALDLYTNLITSGVLLDRARLEELAAAGLQHVQLSFQGAIAATGDRIGGYAGGHEKKLEFGRLVGAVGLPLTVNAVMHRQNMDELEDMIDIAAELGAQRLEVAHVQYYGWGLRNRAALIPTRAQLDAATEIVSAAIERFAGVMVFDYVVPDYYARRPKSCMGGWGQQFLNVAPSGRVMPCHAAETISGMTFESAGQKPLAEIWETAEAFRRFRGTDWMPEPCASCDRREIDWGGCRCQALALTGRADVADPACELSPDHDEMLRFAVVESEAAAPDFVYRKIGGGAA